VGSNIVDNVFWIYDFSLLLGAIYVSVFDCDLVSFWFLFLLSV
jgi:hypothetical protein